MASLAGVWGGLRDSLPLGLTARQRARGVVADGEG